MKAQRGPWHRRSKRALPLFASSDQLAAASHAYDWMRPDSKVRGAVVTEIVLGLRPEHTVVRGFELGHGRRNVAKLNRVSQQYGKGMHTGGT
jgi:hypothetical protein